MSIEPAQFIEREQRLNATQHRIFFGLRVAFLVSFFVWLFAFSDNFTPDERTWISVILLAAIVLNLVIARFLQQDRIILAVDGNHLQSAIAPHEHPKNIDLTQVSRILAHRQYLMLEQPNQKPVQLIFAGKYRGLQGKLLTFLTHEFPNITIERMS